MDLATTCPSALSLSKINLLRWLVSMGLGSELFKITTFKNSAAEALFLANLRVSVANAQTITNQALLAISHPTGFCQSGIFRI